MIRFFFLNIQYRRVFYRTFVEVLHILQTVWSCTVKQVRSTVCAKFNYSECTSLQANCITRQKAPVGRCRYLRHPRAAASQYRPRCHGNISALASLPLTLPLHTTLYSRYTIFHSFYLSSQALSYVLPTDCRCRLCRWCSAVVCHSIGPTKSAETTIVCLISNVAVHLQLNKSPDFIYT